MSAPSSAAAKTTLPASRIVELLDERKPVALDNVIVQGPLSLRGRQLVHAFALRHCDFTDPVDFSEVRFARSVDLTGCRFLKNLSLAGARIDGNLTLDEATIEVPDDEAAAFRLAQIAGDLDARGVTVTGEFDGTNMRVGGGFFLRSTKQRPTVCHGHVRLSNSKFGGNVDCRGALIAGRLYLIRGELGGSLDCEPLGDERDDGTLGVTRCTVLGKGAALHGAQFTGYVSLKGAVVGVDPIGVPPPDEYWNLALLDLQVARVRGGLWCNSESGCRTRFAAPVWIANARIDITANFSGAEVRGSLSLDGSTIEELVCDAGYGSGVAATSDAQEWWRPHWPDPLPPRKRNEVLEKNHPLEIHGDVTLRQTKVKEKTSFEWALIEKSLILDHADLHGNLVLDGATLGVPIPSAGDANPEPEGTTKPGPTDELPLPTNLMGIAAKVNGHLSLRGTQVRGDVVLQGSEIHGGITCDWLGDRRPSFGGLKLPWTRVTGLVLFAGAEFVRAFDLGHSVIDGDLLLARTSPPGEGPTRIVFNDVNGHLSLDSAHVKGDVNVNGAAITDNLSLRGAEIGGAFSPRLLPAEMDTSDRTKFRTRFLDWLKEIAKHNLPANVVAEMFPHHFPEGVRKLVANEIVTCAAKVGPGHGGTLPESDWRHLERVVNEAGQHLPQATVRGTVDLRGCKVRTLRLQFDPPPQPGVASGAHSLWRGLLRFWPWALRETTAGEPLGNTVVRLEGCQFEDLEPPRNEAYKLIEVLAKTDPPPLHTYLVVEKWLREHGYQEDALDLYVSMRRRRRKTLPWWQRGLDVLLDVSTLYGQQMWRMLSFLILLFVVNVIVFLPADSVEPTRPDVQPRPWSWVDATAVAVHNLVPAMPSRITDDFRPAHASIRFGGGESHWTYSHVADLTSVLALPLWSLTGAGIFSLLVRRRE